MQGYNTTKAMNNKSEVERKFLLKEIPDFLDTSNSVQISQAYLFIDEDGNELRLRKKSNSEGDQFIQTYKSKGDLKRSEVEFEIEKEDFHALWEHAAQRVLKKKRYLIQYEHLLIELDEYQEKLEGLLIVEIEFKDEISANKFTPFDWLGREITYDAKFKNKNLWKENGMESLI